VALELGRHIFYSKYSSVSSRVSIHHLKEKIGLIRFEVLGQKLKNLNQCTGPE
jgi:hypothetical protein